MTLLKSIDGALGKVMRWFCITNLLILMVMLVVGGMGRFPGAVIGAFIATFLSELLRPLETYRMLIFGALVILLVIFMPRGISGLLFPAQGRDIFERLRGRFLKK